MQIVLDTRGLQFSVRNKCFFIESKSISRIIHPSRIQSILVIAPCRISSPALILAAQSEIPVVICSATGKPEVRMWTPRFLNIASLRRKQYGFATSKAAMDWANTIIQLKISGQVNNLRYIGDRKSSISTIVNKRISEIESQIRVYNQKKNSLAGTLKKDLLFVEAFAASRYWQTIGLKLPDPYSFTNRVKRNAKDYFNISINYLYGMLRNQTESSILSIGLDPALGIIHRDGYNIPSLVFDLMEPFRPIVDRFFINAIFTKESEQGYPQLSTELPILTKPEKRKLITLFNGALKSRIRYRNSVTTIENHILTEAKNLSDRIKQHD